MNAAKVSQNYMRNNEVKLGREKTCLQDNHEVRGGYGVNK